MRARRVYFFLTICVYDIFVNGLESPCSCTSLQRVTRASANSPCVVIL